MKDIVGPDPVKVGQINGQNSPAVLH